MLDVSEEDITAKEMKNEANLNNTVPCKMINICRKIHTYTDIPLGLFDGQSLWSAWLMIVKSYRPLGSHDEGGEARRLWGGSNACWLW